MSYFAQFGEEILGEIIAKTKKMGNKNYMLVPNSGKGA